MNQQTQLDKIEVNMQPLRLVIVGHVDHGKSTLIGRLLVDTGSIPEGKLKAVKKYCQQKGKSFEYAYLLDALEEEQEQGITIDITQIHFNTQKRSYIIIDAPGHKEFLKNMVSGAASADVAILIIDAKEGVQEQSRRHGYILSLLGIKEVIIAINKMDKVGYSKERFDSIVNEFRVFLMETNLHPRLFIPLSAALGENVSAKSTKMPWYEDSTLLEALDNFEGLTSKEMKPLRIPIQDVYKFNEKRIIVGRIESGKCKVGDTVTLWPKKAKTVIKSIERWHDTKDTNFARAGESIGITFEDHIFAERGLVIAQEKDAPYVGAMLAASIFWMGKNPLITGKTYRMKLTTQEVECEVYSIDKVIDASTLTELPSKEQVFTNDVAEITLKTKNPVVFDLARNVPETGRFVLLDKYEVCGGGVITTGEQLAGRFYNKETLKSRNVSVSSSFITQEERESKMKQKGIVIWFTGLPGSGKTTIARALERAIFEQGKIVYLIEGENIRFGLSSDLGFSDKERKEQTRRLAEVANLFSKAGIITIVTSVSPFREDRAYARRLIGQDRFIEVFVNCPLEICKKRDPHGIYTKAERGELRRVTGIDSPYEVPLEPEIEINTKEMTLDLIVDKVIECIL